VIPDGEDTALLERAKAGPPSPASAPEDPSPPQPQPQPEPEPELGPEPDFEPDPAAIAAEAEKLKEQGNESFKRAKYGEAVDLYTKAIGMSSSLSLSLLSPFLPLPFHPQSLLRFADPLARIDHIQI
jgi:hypothetical protein